MASMTETPVVGGVTTSTAKVGVRADASASVLVEYATNKNFTGASATATQVTATASDYTAVFDLSGLTAATRYFYRVKVDGTVQDPGFVTRFDTFPTSGSFAFAVFADVANTDRSANAYGSAADETPPPLFAMQIGDLDHGNPTTLSAMRQMHRDAKDQSLLHGGDFARRVLSKRALVHIWDDHDYGGNDEDRHFAGRSDAWQAFKEHWPTYALANGSNGLWHSFTCGDAEFFVLDLRSQRDDGTDTDNSDKSILDGALIADDQKDWLKDSLNNSTATWKFVVSSVTFNEDARPSSIDLWHSYSTEAGELASYIADNNVEGVIVLSGDLHTGGAIDDGTNSLLGVPELCVPHTNLIGGAGPATRGTWSEGVTNGARGYGFVTVTSGSVVLEAMAANGTQRHTYTVS